MSHDLTFALHALVDRLDRSADQILQAEFELSYRQFLALTVLAELGQGSQRSLAHALGVTEPSASRMVGVLSKAGLVQVEPDPQGGNRRRVSLTPDGQQTARRARAVLEELFAHLVDVSGVPYRAYLAHTRSLIEALDTAGPQSSPRPTTEPS